jgi:ABC-type glutathione transport system ATPase component
MALVEVDAVSRNYPRRRGLRLEDRFVVNNVSLSIARGETLGLVGESGSGKSTLARMILGLVKPTTGTIRVAGVTVGGAGTQALRRQMQPVFQDPSAALDPRMKVLEIVTEPLVIHRRTHISTDSGTGTGTRGEAPIDTRAPALKAAARELLVSVGLDESALGRYPHEFSGGQRQRINIARALALKPQFVVLDEPVSALDVSVGAQIINLLRTLQREHGLTYLFISHSIPLVRYLSTRIAVMEKGRLVETGEAEALCDHPQESYTRQLLAATPELPGSV